MDSSALKTILRVRDMGSIAGAARALDMDPSSVSRIVAAVEADLGARLFHRTTRRLTVTEEGQRYLQRVAPLLDELEAAKEEAASARTQPSGHLRLTASVAFSCKVLMPLLLRFQEEFPNIVVDLQSSDANLDLVENGIDLAIRLAPSPRGDLISTRLMHTRYKVVASPDYLRSVATCDHPDALQQMNCLRYSLRGLQDIWCFRSETEDAFDVPVRGSPLVSNAIALREAAVSGAGVALLADWLIDADLQEGTLVQLFADYQSTLSEFDTAAWMLFPDRMYLPRKVRVLIDFLKRELRDV
ncbi:LysR family transcriptional regulator [Epibacterium ulvae]|nr:LysR family transcriptional regulator [Epibacterium ulvae]